MKELEEIVYDYIAYCYANENDKVFSEDNMHEWWQANRDQYNEKIEKILLDIVKEKMFKMVFGEEKDLTKN